MEIMRPNILSLENDVLVYTSHGPSKLSYHLIIDHWYHLDNIESKCFYDKVLRYCGFLLKGRYVEFIDASVYKTNQAFRILGSHKWDNMRIKCHQTQYTYRQKIINYQITQSSNLALVQLSKSLITFISDSKCLQSFNSYIYKNYKHYHYNYELTTKDIEEIKLLISKKFNDAFTIRKIIDNQILLNKIKNTYCPICNRIHQNENPVIMIINNMVQWSCRRSAQRYILGVLSNIKSFTEKEVEEDLELNESYFSFGDVKINLIDTNEPIKNTNDPIIKNNTNDPIIKNNTNMIDILKNINKPKNKTSLDLSLI